MPSPPSAAGGFVRNLTHDEVDKAMAETINRIGHILGVQTVAECAESDAIVAELKRIGVDDAQGWAVCRPSPLFESVVTASPAAVAGSPPATAPAPASAAGEAVTAPRLPRLAGAA